MDGAGGGEFSVALRTGVFDGGWAGCTPAAASSRAAWPTTSTTKSA
ncbi:MAG: hypothetical protein ACLSVD_18140 [Eggerthellaceae bacterium]